MEIKKYLNDGILKLGLNIDDNLQSELITYMRKVLEYNKFMNLTSITDEKEFIDYHILDSLTVLPYINNGAEIIDVGTGGGFPGVVLKLVSKNSFITFVDSVGKKLDFIDSALKSLDIKGYECIHKRAEELSRDATYRQRYDICVSRAVANLSVLTELCVPFVKNSGSFIAMKGPSADEELILQNEAYKLMGDIALSIENLELPYSKAKRKLIIYSVKSGINDKYPRHFKDIKKNPLSGKIK